MLNDAQVQEAAPSTTTSAYPRLAKGVNSGAIFLMHSESSGVAITHGTDCFMEKGTRVASMDGMLSHEDPQLLAQAIASSL